MDKETKRIVDEAEAAFFELINEFVKRVNGEESDDQNFKKIINRWTDAKLALANKNMSMAVEILGFQVSVSQNTKPAPQKSKRTALKLNAHDVKFLKSLKIEPPNNGETKT